MTRGTQTEADVAWSEDVVANVQGAAVLRGSAMPGFGGFRVPAQMCGDESDLSITVHFAHASESHRLLCGEQLA